MLLFSDGLNLAVRRLSLKSGPVLEEHDEGIVKSSYEAVCSVTRQCVRILVGGRISHVLPVTAEIPEWSEIHEYRRHDVCPTSLISNDTRSQTLGNPVLNS